ncbi:MAG: aspartate aminotransferase family protein [Chlorogloeopsis fritschii C42_A2020_084]|uniref:pyridoxal phosphate-dependent decarboxylase family protein n=1 Tax=Chlorogloeopsis fritschii TaxID=1124 RepID=UPI0019DE9027|nr:pyridoxal-dependent decarboxylase [Chlorogloeopsis fritschii]MBF2004523.1 aspartate aminotransferase family protein [Chlorogloeopsis fritschii C42_A2020_084]
MIADLDTRKNQNIKNILQTTAEYAIRYLRDLDTRKVIPAQDAIANLTQLDEPLSYEPVDPELVLHKLDKIISPATMAIAGPRFFGFVNGGSLPVTIAANWLATAWDQDCGLYKITPATALLEQVALRWLLDVLRLPSDCAGAFVTGATMASFTALAAARHAVLKREGWNVDADGLFGAPPITVAVGEEVHPSVLKALGLLGLGRNRVVKVPVDTQGRMRPEAIPTLTLPAIICAQVGNVNTGACDPVAAICERARELGAWVHIDGAFGLWAGAAPSLAHLTAGIENADSWATDAHKWLNVPYDSGLAFVRDGNALRAAMAITADFLPTVTNQRNPSDYTPEFSRRARGVEVWAALRSLGRSGLADLIERTCCYARRFAKELQAAGYQILNDVVLNQVLVSFGSAQTTHQIINELQAEGTCWCGITVWQGQTAMRISVSCWSTTDADVERSLEVMLRVAEKYCRNS